MRHVDNLPRAWTHPVTLRGRIIDWSLITFGIILSFSICRVTMGHSSISLLWSIIVCFYFLFYRRIVQIIYWSNDTFRFLRSQNTKEEWKKDSARIDGSPTFHILIAAYHAGQSIGPVLRAAAHQNYPKDQYYTWVITEHSEQLEKEKQVSQLLHTALDSGANSASAARLAPLFWRCMSESVLSIEAWIDEVSSGDLRGHLPGSDVWAVVLEDLLSRLLRIRDRAALYSSGKLSPLRLCSRDIAVIERTLHQIERDLDRTVSDFARVLGSEGVYRRKDLESQLISQQIRKRKLRRIGTGLCGRLSDVSVRPTIPSRETIERAARLASPSTQAITEQLVVALPHANIRHLDPCQRGPKPGALNAAYSAIKDTGLLSNPSQVYFIIIDADSLLHANALRRVANEIVQSDGVPGIMQIAAIPTANFFSGNWFSKFISFADAIGAVGKWARSTRKQLKPDLHAGSGVVVSATLAQFIEQNMGQVWDESTLTEDARLIIGQFGMMDGVRNKTRAVPIHLVEAVPEDQTFSGMYKSFWNQRRRWTVGGYDEFFYMAGSPGSLRHTRFNPFSSRWENYQPNMRERVMSRVRQLHRLALWLWDHFIWGIGGLIVMTHWWLACVIVGSPSRAVAMLGLVALLLAPLVFLLIPGRQLIWFIPGGLSVAEMLRLYVLSFVAIWLYCLPVVATQFACILGFRGKIKEWRPTQKPRYQVGTPQEFTEP